MTKRSVADKYVIDDYVTIGYYEYAGEVAVTSAEILHLLQAEKDTV